MEVHIVWMEFLPCISFRLKAYELYAVIFPGAWWSTPVSHKPFTGATALASMYGLIAVGGGGVHESQLRI